MIIWLGVFVVVVWFINIWGYAKFKHIDKEWALMMDWLHINENRLVANNGSSKDLDPIHTVTYHIYLWKTRLNRITIPLVGVAQIVAGVIIGIFASGGGNWMTAFTGVFFEVGFLGWTYGTLTQYQTSRDMCYAINNTFNLGPTHEQD